MRIVFSPAIYMDSMPTIDLILRAFKCMAIMVTQAHAN